MTSLKWRWPWQARSAKPGERIAITLQDGQLDLVASKHGSVLASRSFASIHLESEMPAFFEAAGLTAPACSLVLSVGSYQVLLVEAPPVPEAELAAALRWKVKDLLQLPLESALIDGFLLPDDAYRGRQKMAYTVAAEKAPLQLLIDRLGKVGVSVDHVLIPEILAAQLINRALHAEQTDIVLVIGRSKSFLNIFSGGSIYLTRSITVSEQTLATNNDDELSVQVFEDFLLELQRSRDYFESQIGKGVVGRVLVLPTQNNLEPICDAIRERLSLTVEIVALDSIIDVADSYSLIGSEQLLLASASQVA